MTYEMVSTMLHMTAIFILSGVIGFVLGRLREARRANKIMTSALVDIAISKGKVSVWYQAIAQYTLKELGVDLE